MEKELSQLLQAQSALDSAHNHFESGDFSKALDYIDKIILIFSPGCLRVPFMDYWCLSVLVKLDMDCTNNLQSYVSEVCPL